MGTSDAQSLAQVAIDIKTMAQYLSAGGRPTEFFATRVMVISDELGRLAARWRGEALRPSPPDPREMR